MKNNVLSSTLTPYTSKIVDVCYSGRAGTNAKFAHIRRDPDGYFYCIYPICPSRTTDQRKMRMHAATCQRPVASNTLIFPTSVREQPASASVELVNRPLKRSAAPTDEPSKRFKQISPVPEPPPTRDLTSAASDKTLFAIAPSHPPSRMITSPNSSTRSSASSSKSDSFKFTPGPHTNNDFGYPQLTLATRSRNDQLRTISIVLQRLSSPGVCVACYARGVPQGHAISVCPKHFGSERDKGWINWRRLYSFQTQKQCYGCGVSYLITFTDRNNASVPLIHSGPLGPRCPFRNTLRCLGYVILHDRSLKAAFLSSIYAKGLDLSRNLTTAFRHWMNQEVDGPITNLLRLALFIADLRGLP